MTKGNRITYPVKDDPAISLSVIGKYRLKHIPIERLFDTITFCTLKGRFCTLQGALLIDSAPKAEKERLLRHLEETLNLQITWSVVIIDKNHRRPLIQSMSYKYSSRFQ